MGGAVGGAGGGGACGGRGQGGGGGACGRAQRWRGGWASPGAQQGLLDEEDQEGSWKKGRSLREGEGLVEEREEPRVEHLGFRSNRWSACLRTWAFLQTCELCDRWEDARCFTALFPEGLETGLQ